MQILEVEFNLDDKNLFLVDDLKLRADAIKNSILPRLEIINNYTIDSISEVYKNNIFELSTVLKFPAFRNSRIQGFGTEYLNSEVGLGGKRDKNLWNHVHTYKNVQPHIVPFSLTHSLDEDGFKFYFLTNRYNINLKNYDIFSDFHINFESEINLLSNVAKTSLIKYFAENNKINPFTPLKEYLKWQKENNFFELPYYSETIKYPVRNEDILKIIERFVIFYPIYDNYLRLCCGKQIVLKDQIGLLTEWLASLVEKENNLDVELNKPITIRKTDYKKLAETKIRVMPAIRWRVFQRDNWRCLSCGRTSEDGIILHIDHIIPRSKGGRDHIDNYQTLCETCNIGKSNKDQTDFRNR